MEYFLFHFYKLPRAKRLQYAGTGFMYEFQLKMNPPGKRKVLNDKVTFLSVYAEFVKHAHISLEDLKQNENHGDRFLKNRSGKVVLKNRLGQCGEGIEVKRTDDLTESGLITALINSNNDLVEEYIEQHPVLNGLSDAGLNTVRVITQLNSKGSVDILGARLRITVNSVVDNLAAGNIAAPIDLTTGVVNGPAVYSDILKDDVFVHPVSGTKIQGFEIPFWKETLSMVKSAALVDQGNRSIGWDIAITPSGPDLVEGNHDWCKLLWQLPVKMGLKNDLLKYLDESKGN